MNPDFSTTPSASLTDVESTKAEADARNVTLHQQVTDLEEKATVVSAAIVAATTIHEKIVQQKGDEVSFLSLFFIFCFNGGFVGYSF